MEKLINITEKAANFIKSSVEKEKCLGIKIDVAAGGCHGMAYELTFVSEVDKSDLIVQEDGFGIYIAPKAVIFLSGMTMDYVTSPRGGELVFSNPNAKSCCGCGKSFSTFEDGYCGGSCCS
ncbi:MAG: iron-sulfur cluster assembly accessory protein [Holosporaceae bacterium]|jgi:iron-sulfur cluster assembly protein|nr:iron-sulfur cluster assembly accessory protein [Holosporaceae bacterium]